MESEQKFPQIKAETLAGDEVVFPDVAEGKISLILVAFERQTQGQVDSWSKPFMNEFGNDQNYMFYEIPMISIGWKVIAPIIDGGMRSGVPKEMHDNVATYYGPLKEYYNKLDVDGTSLCYVYLLDKHGYVVWKEKGKADGQKIEGLFNKAHALNK
ncbi:MAG: hypothetical protein K9I94_13095 [Bacteroidales bacterium]|nr:hypothetical protein [Bacteroidales bacterium]